MYVCICNAIRETDLRAAARDRPGCAETLYGTLGRTPKCRQCLHQAAAIIRDERAAVCLS